MISFDDNRNILKVEEIMGKIVENLSRTSNTKMHIHGDEIGLVSSQVYDELRTSRAILQQDINNINLAWDIQYGHYNINSHRPYIGKVLITGRQVVHGEVSRYVDPLFAQQTSFNASVVRILNESAKSISVILDESAKRFESLERVIQEQSCLINQIRDETEQKFHRYDNALKKEIESREYEQETILISIAKIIDDLKEIKSSSLLNNYKILSELMELRSDLNAEFENRISEDDKLQSSIIEISTTMKKSSESWYQEKANIIKRVDSIQNMVTLEISKVLNEQERIKASLKEIRDAIW